MGDNALRLPDYERPERGPMGMGNALSGVYPDANLKSATKDMKLTPEEQALYIRHLQNLWGLGGVDNADGSRATLYQVGFDQDGKSYNVPSVYNGNILSPDNAIARAMQDGLGQFPAYQSPFEAENRYQKMHGYMERDTADYRKARR